MLEQIKIYELEFRCAYERFSSQICKIINKISRNFV